MKTAPSHLATPNHPTTAAAVSQGKITTLPALKSLQREIIRKHKKSTTIILFISIPILTLTALALLFTGIGLIALTPILFFELAITIITFALTRYLLLGEDITKFKTGFKDIFVLTALKKVFNNLSYYPNRGLAASTIASTEMMYLGDRYTANDYISASYKGINFEQSDIHIEERHEEEDEDGNRRTYWETIFRGRWMVFDFNRKFLSNVRVADRRFRGNILHGYKKYTRIKLEDTEFNKIFAVHAENEFDAFYVLPPDIMERLKNLEQSLGCAMMFCFVDTKLHVAINNKQDSFEYDVFKEIDEAKITEDILKDITLITDFVEELKLDRKIFQN